MRFTAKFQRKAGLLDLHDMPLSLYVNTLLRVCVDAL